MTNFLVFSCSSPQTPSTTISSPKSQYWFHGLFPVFCCVFISLYFNNFFLLHYRGRKVLESRSLADDDRIDGLEKQVKDAKYVAEESDRKYDEVIAREALSTTELNDIVRQEAHVSMLQCFSHEF